MKCSDCNSTYIDKTVRQVQRRLREHGADIVSEKVIDSQSTNATEDSVNLRPSAKNKGKTVNYAPITHAELTSEHNRIFRFGS